MALTFKDVAKKTLEGPGIILSKITDLLFGYKRIKNERDGSFTSVGPKFKDKPVERNVRNDETQTVDLIKQRTGLLGRIASGLKWLGRGISAFMHHNQMGAGIWFWSALLITGAAALTLFLWPAALATVAGFSVFGVSIGAIAGASVLAQIGLSAAVVAAAVTAANIVAGIVKGIVNSIKGCIRSVGNVPEPHVASSKAVTAVTGSHQTINRGLGGPVSEGVPFEVTRQEHDTASYTALHAGQGNANNTNVLPTTSPVVGHT